MKQESLEMFHKCCLTTTITNVNWQWVPSRWRWNGKSSVSKSETGPWSNEVASWFWAKSTVSQYMACTVRISTTAQFHEYHLLTPIFLVIIYIVISDRLQLRQVSKSIWKVLICPERMASCITDGDSKSKVNQPTQDDLENMSQNAMCLCMYSKETTVLIYLFFAENLSVCHEPTAEFL